MVAALVQRHRAVGRVLGFHPDGQERPVLALQHQLAGGQDRRLVALERAGQAHPVALGHLGLGRDDPVQQGAVVGHEQEARGLLVEAPDGRERRIAPPPALGQQPVDQRPRLLVGAGDAERLVQHQADARQRVERLSLHRHPPRQVGVEGDALRGVAQALPVEAHEAGPGQPLDLAARAVAEIGQKPVETERLHLRASNSL